MTELTKQELDFIYDLCTQLSLDYDDLCAWVQEQRAPVAQPLLAQIAEEQPNTTDDRPSVRSI